MRKQQQKRKKFTNFFWNVLILIQFNCYWFTSEIRSIKVYIFFSVYFSIFFIMNNEHDLLLFGKSPKANWQKQIYLIVALPLSLVEAPPFDCKAFFPIFIVHPRTRLLAYCMLRCYIWDKNNNFIVLHWNNCISVECTAESILWNIHKGKVILNGWSCADRFILCFNRNIRFSFGIWTMWNNSMLQYDDHIHSFGKITFSSEWSE